MISHERDNNKQSHEVSTEIKNNHISQHYMFLLLGIVSISIFVFQYSFTEVHAQSPYNSGYSYGCDDAKIYDSDDRYINQPGKGPTYHTYSFMNGYYDGFDDCENGSDYTPTPSNEGTFKIIVEVTNHSYRDISGSIGVTVDHYPYNIFKSVYGIYFPAKETFSKTLSFQSSDVPIGTGFEVDIDYGDNYNQYQYGENTPAQKAEVIHFDIP